MRASAPLPTLPSRDRAALLRSGQGAWEAAAFTSGNRFGDTQCSRRRKARHVVRGILLL